MNYTVSLLGIQAKVKCLEVSSGVDKLFSYKKKKSETGLQYRNKKHQQKNLFSDWFTILSGFSNKATDTEPRRITYTLRKLAKCTSRNREITALSSALMPTTFSKSQKKGLSSSDLGLAHSRRRKKSKKRRPVPSVNKKDTRQHKIKF